MMKKKSHIVLVLVISILTMAACSLGKNQDRISRGEAYKALTLSLISSEDIDCEKDDCSQYANYLYQNDIIIDDPTDINLEGFLTYKEAKDLYAQLPEENSIGSWLDGKDDSDYISKEDFYTFYSYWCIKKDTKGFVTQKEEIFYFADKDNKNVFALGSQKYHYSLGLDIDKYIDKQLEVVLAGTEIIYVKSIISEDIEYPNVYIYGIENNKLITFIGTAQRKFDINKDVDVKDIVKGTVAGIKLIQGKVSEINITRKVISGKVLSIGDNTIEIKDQGTFQVSDDFISYVYIENKNGNTYNSRETLSQIQVGSEVHKFYVENGIIEAGVRTTEYSTDKVRVLLMNSNFAFNYHFTISFYADCDMNIECAGETTKIEAGKLYSVNKDDTRFNEDRMFITLSDPNCELHINSIKRDLGTPSYKGSFEIVKKDDVLYMINEVAVEDYLKKVVPSEMPSSYELEALKSQAVCARTYVIRNIINGSRLKQYGAQIDDSINFQVYNNVKTTDKTDEAVKDTQGIVIKYDGAYAETFYYSTSAGVSTDASIWGNAAENYPYLTSHSISPDRDILNLTTNDGFMEFLKNSNSDAYEKDYSFYRWQTTTTNKILNDKITRVGNILNISITKRGEGGIATKMRVDGAGGSYTISGQNDIRAALGTKNLVITKNDGTTVTGWSSLPSAFLAIVASAPDENNIITFNIYGGGFGHGVGMSQNGSQEMAKAGMDYKQILEFFYDDVDITE